MFLNNVWRCQSCRTVFIWPQPSGEQLKEIYQDSYFKNNKSEDCGYDNYEQDKENIVKTSEWRLKRIQHVKPGRGRLLDVGCALGFFLETAQHKGWDVRGIDISQYAIAAAKKRLGNNVFCGILQEGIFPDNYFDVITYWDCIEHVPDPDLQIRLSAKILKKKGILLLMTPDAGSVVAKLAGDKWMGYKDREHLFYFSRTGLKILLERNGFRLVAMHSAGKHVTLDLFTRRLALYSKPIARLADFLIRLVCNPEGVSVYVNPLDIVTVYAEKL
ncbi:MAG: class I SAM-dependent methyltransferase [Candidatus Yanofskybacteria bacterium]|nr:class I SAM-dependent methyltransferase [Candidatus Yanofskybacteria bacterium]